MFEPNSRIERVDNGIRFYEQDILCSSYIFEGNLVVDVKFDYLAPGFGIVIADDNDKGFIDSKYAYFFKLGIDSFKIYERHMNSVDNPQTNSCIFAPGDNKLNQHIALEIGNTHVAMKLIRSNNDGVDDTIELGSYDFKNEFGRYRVGIYSNAGNVVRSLTFKSGAPNNWRTSIKNTFGGRIAFMQDGFEFENCAHDAEIEQEDVDLKAGTYFMDYKTFNVNGKFDIECYIFPSKMSRVEDKQFEDPKKQLLKKDGSFTIDKDMKVNVKFKGTYGKITNICMKDNRDSSFVRTEGAPISNDGSWIAVSLTGVRSVEWTGIITNTPKWSDLTKPCPYAIFSTSNITVTKEKSDITFGSYFDFKYTVDIGMLTITDPATGLSHSIDAPLSAADNNTIKIFQNITAVITKFVITDHNGRENSVLFSKGFHSYVPGSINSPIIITSNKGAALDLSAAYREVVLPQVKIELFNLSKPLELSEHIVSSFSEIELYGIPHGVTVSPQETEISKYAPGAIRISDEKYVANGNVITLDQTTREKFRYIAARYISAENYSYQFTNVERELFSSSQKRFIVSKKIAKSSDAVNVYGIPESAEICEDRFFRIPQKTMTHSIDLYADKYDALPAAAYTVLEEMNEIVIDPFYKKKYCKFIIDYDKADSYSINFSSDISQYEIDVMSTDSRVTLSYDMYDDGSVNDYIKTDIVPDKSKYIVLKRKRMKEN